MTPNTPDAIVRNALDSAQRMHDATEEKGVDDPAFHLRIGVFVESWTVAVLMETLRRAAPEVADRLARELQGAWDDGGVMDELLWEWRDNLAAGRPLDDYGSGSGFTPAMGIFERVVRPRDRARADHDYAVRAAGYDEGARNALIEQAEKETP